MIVNAMNAMIVVNVQGTRYSISEDKEPTEVELTIKIKNYE